MKVVTFSRASVSLAILTLALTAPAPEAHAGDAHLDAQTVLYLSTDDWNTMREGAKNSDFGRFMQDPEIRSIVDRLKTGVTAMVEAQIREEAGNAEEADKIASMSRQVFDGLMSVGGTMCENMTGRTTFSLSMFMNPDVPVPVNMILEFGGGDAVQGAVDELLALIERGSEGEVSKASFSVAGYSGHCLQQDGMGIYIGRKGDRFVLGLHEAGITAYVNAQESKTVGLGNVPFHQKAMAKVGSGHMRMFLHLEPLWGMAMPMLMGIPVAEGEPNPMQVLQATGLMQVQGLATSGTCGEAGMRQSAFIGLAGRDGLLQLIPSENKPLAAPPFAPSDVITSNSFRVEMDKVLPMIRQMLGMAPEAERAQFEAGLEQVKGLLGFSLDELLSDFEGTMYTATPVGPPPNIMAMMMGGGGSIDSSFALKLKSKERLEGLLAKFADPSISQGMVSKQAIAGRPVYVVTPAGAPMQMATAIEGDWWIIALSVDAMKKSLERVDSGKNLAANESISKLFGEVGGTSGMAVTFKDTGMQLANMLDLFRPLLGMAPMFMPPEAQSQDIAFLFDVTNLPSSATVKKYFGVSAARWSIDEGGIVSQTWSPSKTAPKPKKEPAKTGTGL